MPLIQLISGRWIRSWTGARKTSFGNNRCQWRREMNWKQHYATWLVTCLCGVSPGSTTVAEWYKKIMSFEIDTLRVRDRTLHWKDVISFRIPEEWGFLRSLKYINKTIYADSLNSWRVFEIFMAETGLSERQSLLFCPCNQNVFGSTSACSQLR